MAKRDKFNDKDMEILMDFSDEQWKKNILSRVGDINVAVNNYGLKLVPAMIYSSFDNDNFNPSKVIDRGLELGYRLSSDDFMLVGQMGYIQPLEVGRIIEYYDELKLRGIKLSDCSTVQHLYTRCENMDIADYLNKHGIDIRKEVIKGMIERDSEDSSTDFFEMMSPIMSNMFSGLTGYGSPILDANNVGSLSRESVSDSDDFFGGSLFGGLGIGIKQSKKTIDSKFEAISKYLNENEVSVEELEDFKRNITPSQHRMEMYFHKNKVQVGIFDWFPWLDSLDVKPSELFSDKQNKIIALLDEKIKDLSVKGGEDNIIVKKNKPKI